jgi:cephalosporin-C deacetylase-like acetyl esterase
MTSVHSALRIALFFSLFSCSSEATIEGPSLPFADTGRRILPLPTDAIMIPADTPTHSALNIGPKGTNLGDVDEALYLLGPDFISTVNEKDGWSTLAPVFIPLSEPADPATIDHLVVVDLAAGRIVPTLNTAIDGATDYGKMVDWLTARSYVPLAPETQHAIVVTKGLLDAEGRPFVRAEAFDEALANVERLAGLEAALAPAGIAIDDVMVADTFTTQSIYEQTEVLAAAHRAMPVPELILDADGDGAPDVYTDIPSDPRGNVPDREYPSVRALVRLRFALPNFRVDLDGPLVVDHKSATLQGTEDVELVVLVPNGEGPFPVVVFHHGIGADKELVFDYAEDLCKNGVAVVAMDGALHGYRTDRPGNASTRFLNIASPELILDNFRQAETDQVYLVRVIDELAKIDLLGDGAPELDASRILYVGESLGAILGAAVIGIEPRFEGAVLLVGGGTLLEFFDRVLSGFQFDGFPTQLFTSVAQAAMDRGDPSNYARRSMDKQVYLITALLDTSVPPAASAALARAMELPQVEPIYDRVDALPAVSGPLTRRGWSQHADVGHELFHEPSNPASAVARAQLFHFVKTWVETGVGEIR